MKIDFRKIEVKDLAGNVDKIDVSKVFGNVVFNNTPDIAEYELSIRIYHDGEVDISEDMAKSLVKYAEAFDRVIIRESVKSALLNIKDTENEDNSRQ